MDTGTAGGGVLQGAGRHRAREEPARCYPAARRWRSTPLLPLPLYRALLVGIAAAGFAGVLWMLLAQPAPPGLTIDVPAASSVSSSPSHALVNINTADADELQRLNGIGPRLAERIIAYRVANGPFATVDDLLNVSGIGPTTLQALRVDATAGATAASDTPVGDAR